MLRSGPDLHGKTELFAASNETSDDMGSVSTFEVGGTEFAVRGHVLGPDEGEHLLHFRDGGNIYSFFRAICSPPGAPAKGLSRGQIREVALKYGTKFCQACALPTRPGREYPWVPPGMCTQQAAGVAERATGAALPPRGPHDSSLLLKHER